jgi:hypothetical protein
MVNYIFPIVYLINSVHYPGDNVMNNTIWNKRMQFFVVIELRGSKTKDEGDVVSVSCWTR